MRSIVIGTAGHIDHGKSALVKALTGTDPDRLKEEQARGITIDLGFAHLTTGDVDVAIVDVPGHERFVRNMLAGAGGIDAVLLVVAADESVMPQTREHFAICRLLGIDRGVIALTKSDLADAETHEIASADVRELVAGSFLASSPIVPVSARTGAGLSSLMAALHRLADTPRARGGSGVLRLPVDRVFTVKGFGTVVTGTLVSGHVAVDDDVVLLPGGREARVRGLQVHGRAVAEASAPCRAALNLAGISIHDIARGVTLSIPGALAVTTRFDARLSLLDSARPLAHGARVRVHHGTADLAGRVAIAAVRGRDAGDWIAVPVGARVVVPPGGEAYVRVRLSQPAVITRGDRTVLRVPSPVGTIGGAVVLDPEPPGTGLRRAAALDRFRRLDAGDLDALSLWLTDASVRGLAVQDVVRRTGVSPGRAVELLQEMAATGAARRSADRVFDATIVRRFEDRIVDELAQFHRRHPDEPGMPRETLRESAGLQAGATLFELAASDLIDRGAIVGRDRIALAGHRPAVAQGEQRAQDALWPRFVDAGLAPPDVAAVKGVLNLPPGDVDRAIQRLVREGRLVRVGDLYFAHQALARLGEDVRALRGTAGAPAYIDVATFKERYGLTRKHAIPLLEWLDRERITKRIDERRRVVC